MTEEALPQFRRLPEELKEEWRLLRLSQKEIAVLYLKCPSRETGDGYSKKQLYDYFHNLPEAEPGRSPRWNEKVEDKSIDARITTAYRNLRLKERGTKKREEEFKTRFCGLILQLILSFNDIERWGTLQEARKEVLQQEFEVIRRTRLTEPEPATEPEPIPEPTPEPLPGREPPELGDTQPVSGRRRSPTLPFDIEPPPEPRPGPVQPRPTTPVPVQREIPIVSIALAGLILFCVVLFVVSSISPSKPDISQEEWASWVQSTFPSSITIPPTIIGSHVKFSAMIRNNDTEPHSIRVAYYVKIVWADGKEEELYVDDCINYTSTSHYCLKEQELDIQPQENRSFDFWVSGYETRPFDITALEGHAYVYTVDGDTINTKPRPEAVKIAEKATATAEAENRLSGDQAIKQNQLRVSIEDVVPFYVDWDERVIKELGFFVVITNDADREFTLNNLELTLTFECLDGTSKNGSFEVWKFANDVNVLPADIAPHSVLRIPVHLIYENIYAHLGIGFGCEATNIELASFRPDIR